MWARCVPIYWGNPRVGEEFNLDSMLYRGNYSSDEDFIQEILRVDSDPELYARYLGKPFFHNNIPNEFYDESRVLAFFHNILDDSSRPISHRRKFYIGRWTLAKRQHF